MSSMFAKIAAALRFQPKIPKIGYAATFDIGGKVLLTFSLLKLMAKSTSANSSEELAKAVLDLDDNKQHHEAVLKYLESIDRNVLTIISWLLAPAPAAAPAFASSSAASASSSTSKTGRC